MNTTHGPSAKTPIVKKACEWHKGHSPRPQGNHRHHILPTGAPFHGPENGETTVIDPTSHNNVHDLIQEYVDHGGEPPWDVRRQYGPSERQLAAECWSRYAGASK